MNRKGLKETTQGTDERPDEGFDYNPGEAGLDAWQPDMTKYSPRERVMLETALSRVPTTEEQ